MPEFHRRTNYLFLAALIGQIVLISAQVNTRSGAPVLEAVSFSALSELQRGVDWIASGWGDAWTRYIDLRGARDENTQLREEVARLRVDLQKQRALAEEAARLQRLLDFRAGLDTTTIAARVIAHDPTLAFRTLTIDKGTRDGLAKDMAVLSPSGVVGRIIKPGLNASMVQLLVDRDAGAGALIERMRASGVVTGGHDDPPLRLEYISNLADVRPGDLVVTSGLDGLYPPGFPIGRVETVERGVGLYRLIEIRPAVDFSALEEVLVVAAVPPGAGAEE